MGIIDFIFGRGKVYRLRKKYDRVREKADRIRNRAIKLPILRVLDRVEPTLVMLEEQRLYRMEKRRMIQYVEAGIMDARFMMEKQEKQKAFYPAQHK